VSPETILPSFLYTCQLVPANGRCNPSPNHPVDGTNTKHRPASNGMRPVGQTLVRFATLGRGSKGDDEQEHICRAEEASSDLAGEADGLPVGLGEESEVENAEGNSCVDDGKRV